MDNFDFTPSIGLLDVDTFPSDPASETVARQQFMTLFNQLKEYVNNTVKPNIIATAPSGAVLDFAGTTTPNGWIECDGRELSRTEYANLFAAIGTTWGVGDGTTTFKIPNLTDKARFRRSRGNGLSVGTYQDDEIKLHNHTLPQAKSSTSAETNPGANFGEMKYTNDSTGLTSVSSTGTGSTGGSETHPVDGVFMTIIKI